MMPTNRMPGPGPGDAGPVGLAALAGRYPNELSGGEQQRVALAEAFALADQVGVLERGRLVQAGPPEEIYARPATPVVARFTGLAGEFQVRVRDGNGTFLVPPVPGRLMRCLGRTDRGASVRPGLMS